MTAKQTVASASLVVVLLGSSAVIAYADPPEPCDPSAGEADPCGAPSEPAPRPPSGYFQIGAGFDTDEGFLATARVGNDNLFGTGLQLSLSSLIAARRQEFDLRFADPHVLGTDLALTANLYNLQRTYSWYERQAAGGSLTASRPFSERVRGFLHWRFEDVAVHPDADPRAAAAREVGSPLDAGLFRNGILSALGAGVVYDSRDSPYDARRGSTLGVLLEVADPALGSDFTLATARAWASHHRPLGPFTLHLGGAVTAVASPDPLGVPLSQRLQLDGSGDIRGFAPESLGPVDAFGRPIGGTLKFTARGELELPVVPKVGLSLAGFVDAGGVYDTDTGGTGHSVGLGIRWRSPIGMLRFDWALPLGESGPPRFVFGIGGAF